MELKGFFEGILRVFIRSSKDLSRKFQICFKQVTRVFQGSFKDVSRNVEECFTGVLWVFQVTFMVVSGYVKSISIFFQEVRASSETF